MSNLTETRHAPRPIRSEALKAAQLVQIMKMREAGATFAAIGKILGLSTQTVHADERDELDRLAKLSEGSGKRMRAQAHMRMEAYLFKLQPRIEAGNIEAIGMAMRIIADERKMFGLDVPAMVEWQQHARQTGVDPGDLIAFLKERIRLSRIAGASPVYPGGAEDGVQGIGEGGIPGQQEEEERGTLIEGEYGVDAG